MGHHRKSRVLTLVWTPIGHQMATKNLDIIRIEDLTVSDQYRYGLFIEQEPFKEDEEAYLDRNHHEAFQIYSERFLSSFKRVDEKWRCHVKDWRRCFYWAWKYQHYGSVLSGLKSSHRKYHFRNRWLSELFSELAKILPRWKRLTPKELVKAIHRKGSSIPKWNRGPRASLLLSLFQDWPLYQMLVTMIAIEEGREPETIYKGIKRARRCLKPHKV